MSFTFFRKYYTASRRFKIPLDVNLHGVDFDLVFKLADGREWFRRSEVKPLAIEAHLEVKCINTIIIVLNQPVLSIIICCHINYEGNI